MNKYTKAVLMIFLTLGIIFFTITIYVITKDEFKNEKFTASIRIESIRILKNNFANKLLIESLNNRGESSRYYNFQTKNDHLFQLTCMNDKLIYAQSEKFILQTCEVPKTITFDINSNIPNAVLNNDFKLQIMEKDKIISEFNSINLYNYLNLKDKKNNLSEQREIKLESTDKKIVIYLFLDINISTSII